MSASTTLPSFVELMATLGLDPVTRMPEQAPASPRLLPLPSSSPTRSRSTPSLREQAMSRSRGARYSPYASTFLSARRASVSSSSSSSSDRRADSSSPPSSPRLSRRVDNKLTVNIFGSTSDLSANTPISSFVRRKTPGVSPVSPTFSANSSCSSPSGSPMPFTLPTLPSFLPQSASSDSFPVTPNSDICDLSPQFQSTLLPDVVLETGLLKRPRRTGIRISTPPDSTELPKRVIA